MKPFTQSNQRDHVGLDDVQTLPALLRWRVRTTPDSPAYRWFDPEVNGWTSCSWREIDARIDAWGRALDAERLGRGERIAILLPNGIEHISMDQAALSRGLVPVPLHVIDNPESIIYILQDSGAALLLIDSSDRWQTLVASGASFDSLRRIVCTTMSSGGGGPADARVASLDHWLSSGRADTPEGGNVEVKSGDLAAVVYTSGTTGRPKGVMLSHSNVVANVQAIRRRVAAESSDVFLSFLPLSHTFERTVGYYCPIAVGACVAFARSTRHLPEDLQLVRPTVLVSVPRIYERFHAKIIEHVGSANSPRRATLDLTLRIGGRQFEARQGRSGPPRFLDRLAWPILKRIVADPILGRLGGRLRVGVSGGAPIAEPIIRLFLSLGLDILQGYGMTETSPVISTNSPDDNDPRTVGRPLDGVEVKVGDNDELLVRGANVMVGYWRKEQETRRVIESDGWLHTGDKARIEAGRIIITGRIKDIIVTSTGEKIPPADLETAITSDSLFVQAMVVGENRPFVGVIVVLNAADWARERAQSQGQSEHAILLQRIAEAAKGFPAYALPRAVWWTTEPWTIEGGLLTPTLKIKRQALQTRFAAEIEQLFTK
jgi:long-chain acyl-CoA synthetase